MWPREKRLVYERAYRDASVKTGEARPVTHDELMAELTPCEQKWLGYVDEMEDLEAVLVPCGC